MTTPSETRELILPQTVGRDDTSMGKGEIVILKFIFILRVSNIGKILQFLLIKNFLRIILIYMYSILVYLFVSLLFVS